MNPTSPNPTDLESLSRHGKTFRWAASFLSRAQLQDTAVLYAFCRRVDDTVDDAPDPSTARQGLEAIRESVEAGDLRCGIAGRFNQLRQDCGIETEVVGHFLEGVESDLQQTHMSDVSSLLRYAYQVAGTVGYMMCRLLKVTDARAYPYALDLGIAMQLTNIARDVLEDAKRGRVYLPETLLARRVTAADLVEGHPECRRVAERAVVQLLGIAETYYRSSEEGLHYLPAKPRLAILLAGRIYEAIGTRILARPSRIWRERIHLSMPAKLAESLRALGWAAVHPQFYLGDLSVHDHWLHAALKGLPGADRRHPA